jgi:hypothetical protein
MPREEFIARYLTIRLDADEQSNDGIEPLLDPSDFRTFSQIIKGLPGVKPRVTQQLLRDAYLTFEDFVLHDILVTNEELAELFVECVRGGFESQVVSPAGARLLVRLYDAGALGTKPGPVAEDLRIYCDSEAVLRERALQRAKDRQAYEASLAYPERFTEEQFTFSLLNDLFWHHKRQGHSTLNVGGCEVTKSVLRFSSNSGRSGDFEVTFTWRSVDGTRKQLTRPSAYRGNRRNDPERNFGLPE